MSKTCSAVRWSQYLSVFSDLQHNVVVQDVDRVIHGIDRQICGPFQTNLDKDSQGGREKTVSLAHYIALLNYPVLFSDTIDSTTGAVYCLVESWPPDLRV